MTPDSTLAVTNTCPKDGVHLWVTNMWKQNKAVNPPSRPSGTTGAPTQPEGQPPPAARKHSERDVAHIGPSVVIKGELHGNEDLTVDGVVEGTIVLREHVLTIGPHDRIKAQVLANSVVVLGEVTGDVTASELVDIREGGRWTAIWRCRAWPSPPARISAAASTCRRRRWPDLRAEKIGPRCPHNTRLNPSAPPEEALVPRDVGCCETCFTLFSAAVKEALRSWRERLELRCLWETGWSTARPVWRSSSLSPRAPRAAASRLRTWCCMRSERRCETVPFCNLSWCVVSNGR